jgi:hypothetical protein
MELLYMIAKVPGGASVWKFKNRRVGFECTATLVAYWEVSLDPISGDFTPKETPAADIFSRWVREVRKKYPNGLIPIWWFVDATGEIIKDGGDFKTFNLMPFQLEHFPPAAKDFLAFFTWPVNAKTSELLNWLKLPVVDKLWRPSRTDKGGFIQETTGWKPSILQSYVYLTSLEDAVRL